MYKIHKHSKAITFQYLDIEFELLDQNVLKKWLHLVALECDHSISFLHYAFCSDDALLKMNIEHLQHDYYTDIITFNYNEANHVQGDVFISIDRVKDNAKKYKASRIDELHRVMVHGLLHLCGYNDTTAASKKKMRAREDEALITLAQLVK
jgi:rRNA maturation RNase YbeY